MGHETHLLVKISHMVSVYYKTQGCQPRIQWDLDPRSVSESLSQTGLTVQRFTITAHQGVPGFDLFIFSHLYLSSDFLHQAEKHFSMKMINPWTLCLLPEQLKQAMCNLQSMLTLKQYRFYDLTLLH